MGTDVYVRDWLLPALCAAVDTRRGVLVAAPTAFNTVAIDVTTLHAKLAQLNQPRAGADIFRMLLSIPNATTPKQTCEWDFITRVFTSDLEHGVVILPIAAFALLVHRTVIDGATRFQAIVRQLDDNDDPYMSFACTPIDETLMLETILPAFRNTGLLQNTQQHQLSLLLFDARCDIGPGFQAVPWVYYRTFEENALLATPQLRSFTPRTPRTPRTPHSSSCGSAATSAGEKHHASGIWSPRTPLPPIQI